MYSVGKNTVARLLIDAGVACAVYQDEVLKNLNCTRIQCDEIWSYVGAKDRNVPEDHQDDPDYGSIWTWVAIDADTKLVASWLVGQRDAGFATEFIQDLASRLANRVQLTSDGLKLYVNAIMNSFADDIDYAQLIKIYGNDAEGQKRYSPATCMGCKQVAVLGDPDPQHISTSFVERQNLTMRMSMRRLTSLTNGSSKTGKPRCDAGGSRQALHFLPTGQSTA